MSLVTCDVVEALAIASTDFKSRIDTILTTSMTAASLMVWSMTALLTSTAIASDSATLSPAAMVTETARASSAIFSQAGLGWLVTEKMVAKDVLLYTPVVNVVESIKASNSVVYSRGFDVTSVAKASSTALLSNRILISVVEKATAASVLLGYNDYTLTTSAVATSTIVLSTSRQADLVAAATAHDSVLLAGDFGDVLEASATAVDSVVIHVVAVAQVNELAVARDKALFEQLGMGWVANSENFGMSRYTALPIRDLAVIKGRVFALGDAGLYELTGDTDNGEQIAASVTTGRLQLGTVQKKRIPDVFLTGTMADAMTLTVGVYGDKKGSYTYTAPKRLADSPRGNRVPLGKGLSSSYWKFTLANTNGAAFNIDGMAADVAPSTTRRI